MIDLEDFTPILEVKDGVKERKVEQEEKERSIDEVEREYQAKILSLQRMFKEELERVKEKAFSEGFEEGRKREREKLQAEFEKKVEEIKKEYEERLSKLNLNLDLLQSKLWEEKGKFLKRFKQSLVEALVEIFRFLYINPENLPFVAEKLEEILKDFPGEEVLSIEVGKGLYRFVSGSNVKVAEDLGDFDFRVIFKDFIVESRLEEKLQLLREEIEREVKKSSRL
ncbi:MAG: hypothetical protein ABGX12_00075 [Desulfurobacteriaceae bacterium]